MPLDVAEGERATWGRTVARWAEYEWRWSDISIVYRIESRSIDCWGNSDERSAAAESRTIPLLVSEEAEDAKGSDSDARCLCWSIRSWGGLTLDTSFASGRRNFQGGSREAPRLGGGQRRGVCLADLPLKKSLTVPIALEWGGCSVASGTMLYVYRSLRSLGEGRAWKSQLSTSSM